VVTVIGKNLVKLTVCGLVLSTATAFAGPKLEISEDSWMKLSFLGQAHYSYVSKDGAPDQRDFFLRRGRIILAGQMMDGVKFFMETDNDNAGKQGEADSSTDIQDAFVDVRIAESDHWIQAGLILLPFSFENRSSAASLLGTDYNGETIKFSNDFVWRDYGAELHGNVTDRFAYRAGVFDGYDSTGGNKNPGADLRFTGHLALNIIGKVQTGWFYGQNRLGKSGNYLAVGVGGDTQADATSTTDTNSVTTIKDSNAWVVDVQSGFDLGPVGLTVNAAYYDWDSAKFDGETGFLETGVLVGKTMMTAKYAAEDPNNEPKKENGTVGVHYFMKGHNARAGIEYRWGDSPDQALLGVQFLL